jgi:hypothetical protein
LHWGTKSSILFCLFGQYIRVDHCHDCLGITTLPASLFGRRRRCRYFSIPSSMEGHYDHENDILVWNLYLVMRLVLDIPFIFSWNDHFSGFFIKKFGVVNGEKEELLLEEV